MKEFVEYLGSSLRLRSDGKVDAYSPQGYRILHTGELPREAVDLLLAAQLSEQKENFSNE